MLAADIVKLDLYQVYKASPLIYSVLIGMSLFSFILWLYTCLTIKVSTVMPANFLKHIRTLLADKKFEAALTSCQKAKNYSGSILASGLLARSHGHQFVLEAMQKEGKRCGITLWQRISLINDVAMVAPMLGLLGTVIGLFYAFYDMNRTNETLSSIFDGLGIAIGTTVAGLIVAILAMIFYATLKFRIVKLLNQLENETLLLGNLIDHDLYT